MLIREVLAQATAKLKNSKINTPSLDASVILAHVLGIERPALIALNDEPVSTDTLTDFYLMLDRRIDGECVAYITGKKEFYGLDFLVTPAVLVPRADTEILVETAISISNERKTKSKARVLDLCTGSGAVAIALKSEIPEAEIHATDISIDALRVAKENAERILRSNQISFYLGDLYDALLTAHCSLLTVPCSPLPAPFSLIVSNPPYIPANEIETLSPDVKREPRLALDGGDSGLEVIGRIIEKAPQYLQRGGVLLLEADPRQMKEIANFLEKKGFKDIKLYKDLSAQNRVIGGKYE